MLLTIAIPTFNRAKRLNKCLTDLFLELNKSVFKSKINVIVSNNGSIDNTNEIISKHLISFGYAGIQLISISSAKNEGFDSNIIACYCRSNAKYVWFISDDDNIRPQVIDVIVNDITHFEPSLIYYNHDQYPFTHKNPYITEKNFYELNTFDTIFLLQKIINWPKLSSYVVKKKESAALLANQNTGFHHVTLALECALSEGNVLLSPIFNANPDSDYLDNIDFPPYICNGLNKSILNALEIHNKVTYFDELAIETIDPLISSLNVLGAFYRGKHTLTLSLKRDLWVTVKNELNFYLIKRILEWKLMNELLKFFVSLCYYLFFIIIAGKKFLKIRPQPTDSNLH